MQLFADGIDDAKRLLIAGCDPGISLLAQHLARFDDVDLVVAPSLQPAGPRMAEGRENPRRGSHLRDSFTGEFNLPMVERLFPRGSVKVVTFAIWEQGLVVEAGNPKNIRGVADLARKDVRIVNREKGAGSRELLDQKLQEAGVPSSKLTGYPKSPRDTSPPRSPSARRKLTPASPPVPPPGPSGSASSPLESSATTSSSAASIFTLPASRPCSMCSIVPPSAASSSSRRL